LNASGFTKKRKDKNSLSDKIVHSPRYGEGSPAIVCRECGFIWDFEINESVICPECKSNKIRSATLLEYIDLMHENFLEGLYNGD